MRLSAASSHLIFNFFNYCCDSVSFCVGQPFHDLQDISTQNICSPPGICPIMKSKSRVLERVSGFHRAEGMNMTQAVHAYRISPKFMTALVRVPSWRMKRRVHGYTSPMPDWML